MDFNRTSLLEDYTLATEKKKIDLPVNPLSHLSINISGYNVTDEATLAEILAFLNKIEVTHLGASVFSLQSEDTYMENVYLYKHSPILTNNVVTDNATRELTLIIPFGRHIFNPEECYPSTKKGELTLTMDWTIPSASLDNAVLNIEAVTLPGATPSRYLKSTQLSVSAPGKTGYNDVDLPLGNPYVSLMLMSTTIPSTSSHVYGISDVQLMVNNSQKKYSLAHFNCLKGDRMFRQPSLPRTIAAFGAIPLPNYAWLDFDPLNNDDYLLKTADLSSLKLRMNMAVDEASKINIMELVSV